MDERRNVSVKCLLLKIKNLDETLLKLIVKVLYTQKKACELVWEDGSVGPIILYNIHVRIVLLPSALLAFAVPKHYHTVHRYKYIKKIMYSLRNENIEIILFEPLKTVILYQ